MTDLNFIMKLKFRLVAEATIFVVCGLFFFMVSKQLLADYLSRQIIETWDKKTNEKLDIDFPNIAICAKDGFKPNAKIPMLTEKQYLQNTFDIEKLAFRGFHRLNRTDFATNKTSKQVSKCFSSE